MGEHIVEVLSKVACADDVDTLIARLVHRDLDVRKAAARLLVSVGDTRAIGPLIEALKGTSAAVPEARGVRRAVAEALGKIGDVRAIEPLTAALNDEWWAVREAAAEALKMFK